MQRPVHSVHYWTLSLHSFCLRAFPYLFIHSRVSDWLRFDSLCHLVVPFASAVVLGIWYATEELVLLP